MQPIAPSLTNTSAPLGLLENAPAAQGGKLQEALATREAFTDFIGETFFHQMIKAMRTSVGKPAYFHGGRAEEIFQGQLDQRMAEEMTAASAAQFSGPMFEHQFPHLAKLIQEHEREQTAAKQPTFDDLEALPTPK